MENIVYRKPKTDGLTIDTIEMQYLFERMFNNCKSKDDVEWLADSIRDILEIVEEQENENYEAD